jgi:cell wall-associated NlpC family hydrolase
MVRGVSLVVFFGVSALSVFGQVPAFDKLEMYYAQEHYRIVKYRAENLMDKPDYDFSLLPQYYKSLSLLQLSQNTRWYKRNKSAFVEAQHILNNIKSNSEGQKLFTAHIFELMSLKVDLLAWAEDLKRKEEKVLFNQVQLMIGEIFKGIPDLDVTQTTENYIASKSEVDSDEPELIQKRRKVLVEVAKKQLGVPYSWSGTDPNGFDCSGFTSFVMKEINKEIPRRASDQFKEGKKVKQKNAQKGDLIFFNNGSGISHVGLVVSERGKSLVMIHSSSSKGIVYTEVEKSAYWLKRVSGFATYID